MLGNCDIFTYNSLYGFIVRENAYDIHYHAKMIPSDKRHQHMTIVATLLGPAVGDACLMVPSGTRINAICIYVLGYKIPPCSTKPPSTI